MSNKIKFLIRTKSIKLKGQKNELKLNIWTRFPPPPPEFGFFFLTVFYFINFNKISLNWFVIKLETLVKHFELSACKYRKIILLNVQYSRRVLEKSFLYINVTFKISSRNIEKKERRKGIEELFLSNRL
jgi:hypothetical protein